MPLQLTSATHSDSQAELFWSDGSKTCLHAIWLRDHCHCPQCRSATNGQRFLDVSDIPVDLCINSSELSAQGDLKISFGPDGHSSVYSAERLQQYLAHMASQPHDQSEDGKTLWDAESVAQHQTRYDWRSYNAEPSTQLAALNTFKELGYFVLTDTPAVERQVLNIIDSFGCVRVTNYGELFEVRATLDANNLAYTNIGLGQHTDNPYREPVPTIQALHCVVNTVDGGESLLLDGFMAADVLRRENPEHFQTLCTTRLHFRFSDADTDLRARVPMIEVDDAGRITRVRYNNRSIDTINLPQENIPSFYDAYRHFAQILKRSELATCFKLQAGDCMVFDNTRVMHARTAFSTGGTRHLQGAYSDLDGLYSRLRTLQREHLL